MLDIFKPLPIYDMLNLVVKGAVKWQREKIKN